MPFTAFKYSWESRIGRDIWNCGRPFERPRGLRRIFSAMLWIWSIVAYGGVFASAVVATLLPFRLLVGLRHAAPSLYFAAVSLIFVLLGACIFGLAMRWFRWLRHYRRIDMDLGVLIFGVLVALLCCAWILFSGGTPLS